MSESTSSAPPSFPPPSVEKEEKNEEAISTTTTSSSTTTTSTDSSSSSTTETTPTQGGGEEIAFTVVFKKQTFPITYGAERTVGDLRIEIAKVTGIPAGLQKLMLKGMLKNDSETLSAAGIKNGVKIMLIGSTIQDVITAAPSSTPSSSSSSSATERENLCDKLPHKKIIEKGMPDDLMPAFRGGHDPLPEVPLYGVLNNRGDKVRLTFKVPTQELWISSKANTQKMPFLSIKGVTYEAIKGHEEYHIVILQLGSSEATRYFLYWVPAQYVRAIQNTIMADYTGGY
eukprot:TRINITY_DN2001_c2_g1_i1.p1 TRINITY_DN2001_c2_g1~~TRINITY_DN2001_c2_g1_i1.p1  ORF type:complete len:286 (+),score=112.30 TRINITY_DN2001_c2_g1_i1:67-924(+)